MINVIQVIIKQIIEIYRISGIHTAAFLCVIKIQFLTSEFSLRCLRDLFGPISLIFLTLFVEISKLLLPAVFSFFIILTINIPRHLNKYLFRRATHDLNDLIHDQNSLPYHSSNRSRNIEFFQIFIPDLFKRFGCASSPIPYCIQISILIAKALHQVYVFIPHSADDRKNFPGLTICTFKLKYGLR